MIIGELFFGFLHKIYLINSSGHERKHDRIKQIFGIYNKNTLKILSFLILKPQIQSSLPEKIYNF